MPDKRKQFSFEKWAYAAARMISNVDSLSTDTWALALIDLQSELLENDPVRYRKEVLSFKKHPPANSPLKPKRKKP